MTKSPIVAVLAVQGAFIEHEQRLEALGATCIELRQARNLEQPFDALVLPGGESTVQAKLLHELGMFDTLKKKIEEGLPVLGTCAGLILLARTIEKESGDMAGRDQSIAHVRTKVAGLGTMPVTVQRNAFGRQLGSFHASAQFAETPNVPLTFIRAPYITQIGEGVNTLCEVDGRVVAARYGNQLGVAFHPELDDDNTVYSLFLSMIRR